jgi:hypothetical protein
MNKPTLTIILCQTRESNFTYDSLERNVLGPLKSDLAFCGSSSESENSILKNAKYIWNFNEPTDWSKACDSISKNDSDWRVLVDFGELFLGGSGYPNSKGSGLIIMYWREILKLSIGKEITDKYEWFVITRSDFKWICPHPPVEMLDPSRVYVLDGEKYGGFSDRHIIFNRKFADQILSLASPIFGSTSNLKEFLEGHKITNLNPERYLHLMMQRNNLLNQLTFLPYLGFTVRHEQTKTRWSSGVYNKSLGVYVKYPNEFKASFRSRFFIRDAQDWVKFLGNEDYFRRRVIRLIETLSASRSPFKKFRSVLVLISDKFLQLKIMS